MPTPRADGHTPAKCRADCPGCNLCNGGLVWCTTCLAAEGELTTHCPGRTMSTAELAASYAGTLDFKDGAWVKPEAAKAGA
jgi:hypothetical protein